MSGRPKEGVISRGIKTPVIKEGDNLVEMVVSSVIKAVGEDGIDDKDIIAVTEAVVAISQGNFVTKQNIIDDIRNKFPGVTELAIVDPIQSRNRFMEVLKAVASVPELKKVYIIMTYPTDEVGNRFISDEILMESGVNPYEDVIYPDEFYEKFGTPVHPFTGKDYIAEYKKACNGKAEVVLCNNFTKIPEICENVLVCSIHRKKMTRKLLEKSGAAIVKDLSEIMAEPIDGSGYNSDFGLYGTNLMDDEKGILKLMPRDCYAFVHKIQDVILQRYNKHVEVMVYGDGAFKDPVGHIWELADPTTTVGATEGLAGTPKEVKLKYLASIHKDKTPEEIEEIVAQEKAARMQTSDVTGKASLGTTPRQITDLVASLADLTTGSGDRQTPVVLIKNYLA